MRLARRQRGVALVTAILLVAIATALATKLAWDNTVSMRRTETLLVMEQARLFALGAEAAASNVLSEDDPTFDHSGDDWAFDVGWRPLDIDEDNVNVGEMRGTITDAQGKFNLNNLVPQQGSPPDTNARRQFEDLIDILRLDPSIVDVVFINI